MAVYWTRTGEVAWGKGDQAMEWALKVVAHVNSLFPESSVEVLTNISGRLSQIHWVRKYDSLAQMEKIMKGVRDDQKYQAMVKEMTEAGLFESFTDRLYRTH